MTVFSDDPLSSGATKVWLDGPPMPSRWQHTAASWGDGLLLYGGTDADRGHAATSAAHLLTVQRPSEMTAWFSFSNHVAVRVRPVELEPGAAAPA